MCKPGPKGCRESFAAKKTASQTNVNGRWPAYEAALKASGVKYEAYVYSKTNHGLHNDTTPRYEESAAKLAWQRTLDHFNKYLKG